MRKQSGINAKDLRKALSLQYIYLRTQTQNFKGFIVISKISTAYFGNESTRLLQQHEDLKVQKETEIVIKLVKKK